jgi:protein-S-isoprenylcysteine O-methyltransferase Ste14
MKATSFPEARPVNQKKRIWVLRCLYLAVVPLLAISRPIDPEQGIPYSDILEIIGFFVLVGAVIGRLWAVLYIGSRKNQEVVSTGPYSLCRHPLYLFSTMAALSFGLLLGSILLAVSLGGITLLVLSANARREETFLRHSFGADYQLYSTKTPMILPSWKNYNSPESVKFSVGPLRSNFLDAILILGLLPLAEFIDYLKENYPLPGFYLF